MNTNNVSVLHGLLDELLNAHSAFLNGDISQPVFNLKRSEVMKTLAQPSEQPAKRRVYGQPAAMGSYDICSHGVVGGCLRDDPEQPAKAEQPGDVSPGESCWGCNGTGVVPTGDGYSVDGCPVCHPQTLTIRCTCSGIPPTMPVYRDGHLPSCPLAALSPSVPAEAVAFVRMRGDSIDWESREPQFFKDAIASDAGDYPTHMGYWTAPLFLAPPANDEATAWHSDEREKGIREATEFMRALRVDESLPSNIRASAAMLEARFEKLTGDEFVPVEYLLERERDRHRALAANDEAVRLLRWALVYIKTDHTPTRQAARKELVGGLEAFLASQQEEQG